MTAEMVIRDITDADVEAVIALWHAAGISRPWNDPGQDIAFARRNPHSTVLVADLSGRIAATVMVGEDGHRGWVYYVATDPALQRTGLGRTMMDAAETWLRDRGVWKVQLLIRADNLAAQAFYERLGYGDTRTTCMQKVLQAPEPGETGRNRPAPIS